MTDDNGFYQQIENHDAKERICNIMLDHYNFLLGLSYNTASETKTIQYQFNSFKCYDI